MLLMSAKGFLGLFNTVQAEPYPIYSKRIVQSNPNIMIVNSKFELALMLSTGLHHDRKLEIIPLQE